ncbi:MAG: aryl-sulfate sulfotransferase [Candidatus Hodarchaeota archaeon]
MPNIDQFYRLFRNLSLIFITLVIITNLALDFSFPDSNLLKSHVLDFNSQSQQPKRDGFQIRKMLSNSRFNYQDSISVIPILNGVDLNITASGDYFKGYNLFELTEVPRGGGKKNRTLLIISTEGDIFAEMKDYRHPTKFLTPDTVLCAKDIGNKEPNAVLWNIENNSTEILDFFGHHDFEWNPNNDTFFVFLKYRIEIDGVDYIYDTIEEYTKAGQLVWSLDTRTFIPPTYLCPFHDLDNGAADMTHSNSIFFDPEEDIFYYNPRNPNTFYKIDHKTGEVIWGLGEYGNFTLFDQHGKKKESLFYHAHALEKVDENTFILLDNNFHNQTGNVKARSRILEITINEKTMTANESWAWVAPREYFSASVCDADRLPNGNRLGTFGMNVHPNTNLGARVVEVNDTGHIVWEMNFPNKEETTYRIYHVDRFRFDPILSPVPDIQYKEDDLIVTWQTWYGFRTNRRITENYTIYCNNKSIHNGKHTFEKFWQPTYLTVNLGNLELKTSCIKVVFEDSQVLPTRNANTTGFDFFLVIAVIFTFNFKMLNLGILKKERAKSIISINKFQKK